VNKMQVVHAQNNRKFVDVFIIYSKVKMGRQLRVFILNLFHYLPRLYSFSPNQRHGAPFRGEGTNSARLFTPGERKALAKCEVHQTLRAAGYDPRVDLSVPLI
jgi:hypothetical protein